MDNSFICRHCGKTVSINRFMGTNFRNHCPFCLFSTHVDWKKSGDRLSKCNGEMEPIGLTFKIEGTDKYGKKVQGELMIVHRCSFCQKFSINRIAADDDTDQIMALFEKSKKTEEDIKKELADEGIKLLSENDEKEIKTQLFGRKFA